MFAVFAEDILWHVPGRGPLSRDYRGHAEVAGFFEHFIGLSEGTFQLKIDEILANRDRVVVLCTESASRAGRSWSSQQVHVWTVKDGRATAFWEYEGDQQGEDEGLPALLPREMGRNRDAPTVATMSGTADAASG